MAHKSSKSKHKKKYKKEKSKHKKKYKKKEKERSRKYSSSSGSSSSTSVSEDEREPKKQVEWNFLESALSEKSVFGNDKKAVKPKESSSYDPQYNPRELNPYWRENGTGLPSTTSDKPRTMFLKPGEGHLPESSKRTYQTSYQSNWRKKTDDETSLEKTSSRDDKPVRKEVNESSSCSSATAKELTNEEMNKLAAKIVKAEIMGNTGLVEKLKAELNAAKEAKESGQGQGKRKEVVILTDNKSQFLKTGKSEPPAKKQKMSSARKEMEYNSDKYSLGNLFVMEKGEKSEEFMLPSRVKVTNLDEFDDAYLEAAYSKKSIEKRERKQEEKSMKDAVKKHKTLEGCPWCLDNRNNTKHLIVSTGTKCYMSLPQDQSLTTGHCYIVPIQHEMSTRKLDEDVWEELKMYKLSLVKMFSEQGMDVVFFESARGFRHYPHCYVQCVPLEKEMGDLAPIYFQKALSESETEWSNNKKVIDFRQKDLRRSIPKDLPYFAISFGTEGGFAHIIEDEQLFPRNFAEEVIGGMLDLDHGAWRKPSRENFNAQREKALTFLKTWKKYEFNKELSESSSDSD